MGLSVACIAYGLAVVTSSPPREVSPSSLKASDLALRTISLRSNVLEFIVHILKTFLKERGNSYIYKNSSTYYFILVLYFVINLTVIKNK